MEEGNSKKKQLNLFGEEDDLPFENDGEKDAADKEFYDGKLAAEKFRKAKMENDIKAGLLVYKSEAKEELANIVNMILSSFNAIIETKPVELVGKTAGQIREALELGHNSCVENAQNLLENYLQTKEADNG